MKSTLECIPCFVQHALHIASKVSDDENKQFQIIRNVLAEISQMDLEQTPPEMARFIHKTIKDITGMHDPYREDKDKSTEFALKLLPYLRKDIEKSDNPFETIVRFVIAGNIIDFGADRNFKLETAHHRVMEVLELPIDYDAVKDLKHRMENAENILYLADNCGEAVFDRLLIEPFKEKITYVVRAKPILNDITMREIEESGLAGLPGKIIDNGDYTPGTSMNYVSEEFKKEFFNADLIISKGQGNFETLSDVDENIFFLFRAKCHVITALTNTEKGSLIVYPKQKKIYC